MSYSVYVTRVKNIRPAENADRLNLCNVFGNTVVVGKDVNEEDLYIYFPTDGQISEEFGKAHDLFRRKDEDGKPCGGFIDPNKRSIQAIRLRGNKSDGLLMSLKALEPFGDISGLAQGDRVEVFNGHEIAKKYVPAVRHRVRYKVSDAERAAQKKKKENLSPQFAEHSKTTQLAYNLNNFAPGDEVEITLKVHGTSQRTGYLPVSSSFKRTFVDRLLRRPGTPIYEYQYISGTRRTVLESFEGGFYASNKFREPHHNRFIGKLHKGETVYYEVVGFVEGDIPIMRIGKNKKLGKDFVKKYGEETLFNYGCGAGESEIYVYRMTLTTEEGYVVEYSPHQVRLRCEQMGINTPPVLDHFICPDIDEDALGEYVLHKAEEHYEGADPIGKTHIREGVVCRIVNREKFTALKHKNFEFKVLEGIIKEEALEPDLEEREEYA